MNPGFAIRPLENTIARPDVPTCWNASHFHDHTVVAPLKRVSIDTGRQLILNWFEAKKEFSSGIVEGLNYKIKLTIRKAYGFRTLQAAEIALYHALGRLPEPQLTHEFC